mmetsp:Transcript_10945/g.16510  ORF Transcript_10945/g.16510 Transcript_10945/m.16510 type:complete len:256 (-) Transcript_10945:267-1034(-)|eukprot:CAMPEP_0116005652 /NCGR_PEP_ID=MMETSP0321-20121206/1284_1 /TAXON_ID=163516 /ORGANISM="Leptocylindrus danicus var. danicus, Strain B650" /LENGTH=255 /DNA_ID=CAMNT_0003474103 /DNA_START=22 /DNA_END=789 /DNA_ORIENTATION=-
MIEDIILRLAEWAWGSDPSPEVSPEICLGMLYSFTIPSVPCLSGLITKVIGIAIITGACLNKAPIVFNILSSKSVAGLSSKAAYSETLLFSNAAFYGFLRGNPFTAYGETLIMTVQAMGICFLIWKFRGVTMREVGLAFMVYVLYLTLVFEVLPKEYYFLLQTVNWPILLYSRGSQIYENMTLKHTGNQAIITHFMNFFGSFIRILTTIKEVGWDMVLLSGYGISVFLNITLLTQCVMYMKNTKAYFEELKKKKD